MATRKVVHISVHCVVRHNVKTTTTTTTAVFNSGSCQLRIDYFMEDE